jgi:hypothetical protein
MGFLLKLLGGSALDTVDKLLSRFFPNKEKAQDNAAIQDSKVLEQYAAESLQVRENRTAWDSFVDGLNRIVRPLGFFLTVWVFVWPIWNLENFQVSMVAYEAIPEWLAGLIITVWSLFFTGRFLEKRMSFKAKTSKEIADVLASQKAIHQAFLQQKSDASLGQSEHTEPKSDPYATQSPTPRQYDQDMKSKKPLPLPSIVEWNRRNRPQ